MTSRAEMDRAYLRGVSAKQCGKPVEANPYRHRTGRDGELLRDRWVDGWRDTNKRGEGE